MPYDCIQKLRDLVENELLASSTLGVALSNIADELEGHARGVEALTERVERLEHAVLPRAAEDVGRL